MTPESIQAEYAPRIAEAARRDEARRAARAVARDGALLSAPHDICGISIRVMTLEDYLTLSVLENANVAVVPEPEDPRRRGAFWAEQHGQFLWYLRSGYVARRDAEAVRSFMIERIAPLAFEALEAGVAAYLREMFADAPKPAAEAAPGHARTGLPHGFDVSFAVHWIAQLAGRFHWSRAEIRALPLPEMFQYLRLIRAERHLERFGKFPPALDGEVDQLWAEMLARVNEMRARMNEPSPS